MNMSLNRGLIQTVVEPRMRGRVMSIDMMSHGLMPLGVIPISIIAEYTDVAVALVVSGVVFAAALGILLWRSAAVRRLDRWLRVGSRGERSSRMPGSDPAPAGSP